MKYGFIEVPLKPSRLLSVGLSCLSGAALVAIAWAALPLTIQLLLGGGVLISLVRYGITWRRPLPEIKLDTQGRIQIKAGDADWQAATILAETWVSPGLCVVSLRTDDNAVHRLSLLPDSAQADDLRRLRVALLWGKLHDKPPSA